MTTGISWVSVGVADLNAVQELWVDQFGLDVVGERSGGDQNLASLWNIQPEQIGRQLLLKTPGAQTGQLHFVEFTEPGPAIRGNAHPYDYGAKNLDVNCSDLPGKMAALKQAGFKFRSDLIEYQLDDVHAREVQMPAHDGVNVAFIDVLSTGYETPYTTKGFAALTSFVVIVADTGTEVDFYKQIFGLKHVMHHELGGPDIEKAIGLPTGATLDMHLLGHDDNMFGRMEIINYEGMPSADRFSNAHAPATGILSCGFEVTDMNKLVAIANAETIDVVDHGELDLIIGKSRFARITSPAGLQIELREHCL